MRALKGLPPVSPLYSRIPLGPLAGLDLEGWLSPASELVHMRRECPDLPTHEDLAAIRFTQPAQGMLADALLPKGAHCRPVGEPGAYLDLVDELAAADREVETQREALRTGLLLRAVVDERGRVPAIEPERFARWPALRKEAEALAMEQRELRTAACGELQRAGRLERMLVASWLEPGDDGPCRPRQFSRLIEHGVEAMQIVPRRPLRPWVAMGELTVSWLQCWLSAVRLTGSFAAGRASIQSAGVDASTAAKLSAAWGAYVDGACALSRGEVLVYRQGATRLAADLEAAVSTAFPSAPLESGDAVIWVVIAPSCATDAMRGIHTEAGDEPPATALAAMAVDRAEHGDDEETCRQLALALASLVDAESCDERAYRALFTTPAHAERRELAARLLEIRASR